MGDPGLEIFGSGYGLAAGSCGTLGNEHSGAINRY
jgi:hypothetical protein